MNDERYDRNLSPNELIIKYVRLFNVPSGAIELWCPYSKDSIKIRHEGAPTDIIFTYRNDVCWRLETAARLSW